MAVTANQLSIVQNPHNLQAQPVAASKRLYAGTLVFLASGYATDAIAAGANKFAGVAAQEVDNSSGAAGDKNIETWRSGRFTLAGSGFTQASVGVPIYASDNYTVTATSTSNTLIGRCVEYISATSIVVDIEPGTEA
jgi:predicted RecA/RadA family phage recombinase